MACSGLKPGGSCRAIALAAVYGVLGTPGARLLIRVWFQRLGTCDSKEDLRDAWSKAVEHFKTNYNHKDIKGVMTNLIALLMRAGWVPVNMFCWKDSAGSTWTMGGIKVSPDTLAAAVIKDLFLLELRRARHHYNGKGIRDGIHVD